MPMMAAGGAGILGIGGAIGGGFLQAQGAKKQLQLMRDALNYQKGIDTRTYGDLSPYRQFGAGQLNNLTNFLQTKDPSKFIDPGYQFRTQAGINAINNNAATGGMLQSGDTLKALEEYGQGQASQEYGNAFTRYLQQAGMLQGLAGMGQNAAVQGGSLANQGASNVGQISAATNAAGPSQAWANALTGATGIGSGLLSGKPGGGGGGGGGVMNSFSNIFSRPPQYGQNFSSPVGVAVG